MRAKGQHWYALLIRGANRGFPINPLAGSINDDQHRSLLGCKMFLEGRQRAYDSGVHVVVTQGVAYLDGEEEVLFKGENRYCHGSIPTLNLQYLHILDAGKDPLVAD